MDKSIIFFLLGIAFATFRYIFPWSNVRLLISRTLLRLRGSVDVQSILKIENPSFIIENKELLQNKNLLKNNRFIYWPAIPTDSPSLIHAAFIRIIVRLIQFGLRPVLFVFDNYYGTIVGKTGHALEEDVKQFLINLYQMGLPRTKILVIRESSLWFKQSSHFMPRLLANFGQITKAEIDEIAQAKSYMGDDTKFIRYLKPVLNLSYMPGLGLRFGFTLSGFDEAPLWRRARQVITWEDCSKVTNLYIPIMKCHDGVPVHILEKSRNITFCDSIHDIREKIMDVDLSMDFNIIPWYALEYIYFANDLKLAILRPDGETNLYSNLISISNDLASGIFTKEALIEAILPVLYKIMHPTVDQDIYLEMECKRLKK